MIKFFRRIRKQLLTENKFSKYLLYAIGEIVLVVVGILIALSINNWNEWKKERIKEREILIDMAENLETNIKALDDDIEYLHLLNKSSEIIISSIYNSQPYADTLAQHFDMTRIPKQELFLSRTGYEGYKDIGLQILTNKNLKKEVLTLFESSYPRWFSSYKQVNVFYPEFDNHVVQNFIYSDDELVPLDYSKLLTDHFYISWVRAYKEGRKYLIKAEGDLLNETQRVHQLIINELE